MDATELAKEKEAIEKDILKLQLHSVPLNLNYVENHNQEEEEEDEEDGMDEDYLLSAFEDPDQPSTSGVSQQQQQQPDISETSSTTKLSTIDMSAIEESDDEEEKILEPEQEVIDLSADLSPTPKNLLKLNVAYQEVIQQQLHFIEELLHQNKCKQDDLDADMNEETNEELNPRKARTKADLGLCIAPYFKAGSLVGPPSHADVLRRYSEIGENFIQNALRSKPWKPQQVKDLIAGVERDAIRVKTEPLLSKLEYLEEKYKMKETDELKAKMEEVRQKILEAKESKPSVLHGNPSDPHDWSSIANIALDGAKTAAECEIFWKNNAHPSINHGNWTSGEDERLKALIKEHKEHDWQTIAKELNTGRTAMQCIQRYQRKINVTHRKKPWTPEEDEKLTELVEKYRVGDAIPYSMISLLMKNRSSTQVVHRWTKTVNPQYSKEKWTAEEDVLLLRAIARHGTRWAYLRDMGVVPGRNDAQMRERYQNVLAGVRRGPWTASEDDELTKAVERHGEGNWAAIATDVDGRTDSQVMKRWKNLVEYKLQGRKVKYKARPTAQLHIDGITKIRQKLMDSIQEEVKKRKGEKFTGGLTIDENTEPFLSDIPTTSGIYRDDKTPTKLQKDTVIKVADLKKDMEDPFYFARDLGEKLKDMSTEEVFGIYQYVTSKKEKREKKWNRRDALVNINMMKSISQRYRPYQVEARIKGTNANIIRGKVLETAKKITPRILFTHYIRAMNVDAERTLSTIRNKGPTTTKPMENGEAENKTQDETRLTPGSEDTKATSDGLKSPPFKRNLFLPLCAPNIATVRAYRSLMKDRDRRVASAKTILIDDVAKKSPLPDGDEIEDEPQTSGENPTTDKNVGKYKPEQLIKNIQLSQQHKMFRSRFVSLFAWPTILSTLVPYQRFGATGELKAVVRLPKKDSINSDQIPIRRRKLDKGSGLNATQSRISRKRPHEF